MKKSLAISLSTLIVISSLSMAGCTPAAQDRTPTTPARPSTLNAPPAPAPAPTPAPTPALPRTQTTTPTYRSAPEIARRVTQVPGVASASVLVTDRTAYVAVNQGTMGDRGAGRVTTQPSRTAPGTLRNTTPEAPVTPPGTAGTTAPRTWEITDQTKQRIADVVRQTDPEIQRVFVTANPAVFSRFESTARDLANGRPITALADLTDMIRRIWPTAK